MKESRFEVAVEALVRARRSGQRITSLPAGSHPNDLAEAHALQETVVAELGENVAGWKVSIAPDGGVMRGIIVGSRLLQSPAALPAADVPLCGIEGEIAFRIDRPLPARERDYSAEEIAAAVTAVVGIEIVDSRFCDYTTVPPHDRTADCMLNGGLVIGTHRPDWRRTDLSKLEATLRINGNIIVRKIGGHISGDALLPAVALVNDLRHSSGVMVGQVITTGTYIGLYLAAPGDVVEVEFTGFGRAVVMLTA